MNRRKTLLRRIIVSVVAVLAVVCVLAGSAEAASSRKTRSSGEAISEEKMPGTGAAKTAGLVLAAGAVVVGIKNARRTHLD